MKSFTAISIATGLFASTGSASVFGLPKRQQDYRINPDTVSSVIRDFWCEQQRSACPLICLQTAASSSETNANDCNPDDLTFACVCADGLSPNLTEYSQTIPYYTCQEWGNQCVANCGQDNACQSACRDDHPCGAQSPTLQNTSTLTSTMMSTTTADSLGAATTDANGETFYTGFGGAQASETGGSGGSGGDESAATHVRVWALSAGQTFGMLGLVGAFVGGFAVLL